jgi:transcriptional regulator with XRE-family HTH domain
VVAVSGTGRMLRCATALTVLASAFGSPVAGATVPAASSRSSTVDAPDPAVVSAVRKGVVRIVADTVRRKPDGTAGQVYSSGSGFIVSTDGLIVTNYHVMAGGSDPFDVYLDGDDLPWQGALVGYNECSDLAVLRIDAPGPVPLTWASSSPEVGRGILAAGYPEGDPRFALMDGFIQRESGPWPNAWSNVGSALEHTAHVHRSRRGGISSSCGPRARRPTSPGSTQAEFAHRVGMQQSVIARMESGRHAPNVKQLERIAGAFDLEWRVTFEPVPVAPPPAVVEFTSWTYAVHPQPDRTSVRHVVAASSAIHINLTIPPSNVTLSRTAAGVTDRRVMTFRDFTVPHFVDHGRSASQGYARPQKRLQASRPGPAVACSLAS